MEDNITVRTLVSKLSVKAIWGIISSIVIVLGGTISAGFQIGSMYYANTTCHSEVCNRDKEIASCQCEKVELRTQILDANSEIDKCQIVVFTMERKNKNLEPIIKMLLENYERDLKKR